MRAGLVFAAALAVIAAGAGPAQARKSAFHAESDLPTREFQWLYGSGEAAATSIQAYNALTRYVFDRMAARARGEAIDSAVLVAGADPASPQFEPCGDKPFAVVFDVDETVMLNTGYEYYVAGKRQPYEKTRAFDRKAWDEWAQKGASAVDAVPGARAALDALRAANVTVIFNTNRSAATAAGMAEAIAKAGLGETKLDETLFLDADGSGLKDGRRTAIAARWCVVAMGGDQLGDFSDRFNVRDGEKLPVPDRRALAQSGAVRARWGNGWFLLPNPTYGSGANGTFKDVFPGNRRWMPTSAQEKK